MILYNITLGNLNLTPDSWSHITDTHGNHFIAKDDIHQRIRIDNKVDPSIYPEMGELTPVWAAANMQCYNILPDTRWVNNNRNMNPLLLMNKDSEKGKEQIVIYITVSNNYAIGHFKTSHRILQTYHKKDTFQGCAVVLNTDDISTDNRIICISVYDKKKNQYNQFNIYFNEADINKINIDRRSITNAKLLESLKKQVDKFNNRYMGFKIITKPDELLTIAYVTSDKFKDSVKKATKDIKNAQIISINPDQLNDTSYVDYITTMLDNELSSNRIRAITQCGVNLALDIIRNLKLLYVFNYDTKNRVLSCRKSN